MAELTTEEINRIGEFMESQPRPPGVSTYPSGTVYDTGPDPRGAGYPVLRDVPQGASVPASSGTGEDFKEPYVPSPDVAAAVRGMTAAEEARRDPRLANTQYVIDVLNGRYGTEQAQIAGRPLGAGARFNLGFGENAAEREARFKGMFPEGDYVEIIDQNDKPVALYRTRPDEPFAKVDAELYEEIEILADLADFSGEIAPMIGDLAAGKFIGKGILRAIGVLSLGGASGKLLEEAIEEAQNLGRQSNVSVLETVAMEGVFSGVGGALSKLLEGPLNFLFRGFKQVEGAEAVEIAGKELGIGFLPSQIAASPLLRKVTNQVAVISTRVAEYMRSQVRQTSVALLRLRQPFNTMFFQGQLKELHEMAAEQIIRTAAVAPADMAVLGSRLQRGVLEYEDLSGAIVDRLYAQARNIEEPIFDASSAIAVSREASQGVPIRLRDDPAPLMAGDGGLIDWTNVGVPFGTVRQPSADLQRVLDVLNSIDPEVGAITIGGKTYSGTDQLRSISSALWEFTRANVGVPLTPQQRLDAAIATKVRSAVQGILQKPANTSAAFRDTWARAGVEAATRFDTLEKLLIVAASASETPSAVAARVFKPNNAENVRLLRTVLQNNVDMPFERLQESYIGTLLARNNIDDLTKTMGSYDRSTLYEIFDQEQIDLLTDIGRQWDDLKLVGIEEALDREARFKGMMQQLFINGGTRRIEILAGLVENNPAVSRSIRAGLIDFFADSVVGQMRDQSDVIIDTAFEQTFKAFEDRGLLQFLNADDIATLRNIRTVLPFLPSSGDVGASMHGAAIAESAVLSIEWKGMWRAFRNATVGRWITNPAFQRFILREAGERGISLTSKQALRIVSAMFGNLAADAKEENRVFDQVPALEELSRIRPDAIGPEAIFPVDPGAGANQPIFPTQ